MNYKVMYQTISGRAFDECRRRRTLAAALSRGRRLARKHSIILVQIINTNTGRTWAVKGGAGR